MPNPTQTQAKGEIVRHDPKAVALIQHPVHQIGEFHQRMGELTKHYTVVTPLARVDSIPPMSQISFRLVDLDLTPQGSDLYQDRRFCKDGEAALAKGALLKIAAAAGIQKLATQRVDDGSIEYFWRWSVTIAGLDYDGTWRQECATKELDLRDGAPETLKPERDDQNRKTGKQVVLDDTALAEKRRHGAANAETKALLRALREFFALPHKVRVADLRARPIVIPKLVPHLDTSDPEVKAAVLAARIGGEATLFGPRPQDGRRASTAKALRSWSDRTDPMRRGTEGDPDDDPLEDPPPQVAAEIQPEDGEGRVVDSAGPEPFDDERPPDSCLCPCGCTESLKPVQIAKSTERLGAPRCTACYPDEKFDQQRHATLRNLDLPKFPEASPAQVAEWNKRRKKAKAPK